MRKRFQKLHNKLIKSDKIVLICTRDDTIEEFESFLLEFSLLYSHLEIRLINIRNNDEMTSDSFEKQLYIINDYLSIEEYVLNDSLDITTQEKFDWRGNIRIWQKILSDYYNKNDGDSIEKFKNISEKAVIYGAGKRCRSIIDLLDYYDISIKGIAVTDCSFNPRAIGKYSINTIDLYDFSDTIIISLANRIEAEAIAASLLNKGYTDIHFIDEYFNVKKFFC